MAQPALIPAVPTAGLWLEIELVWRRKHIAFYQGSHVVKPLVAGDLDTLHATEVLTEWALGAGVWPELANLCGHPVPGASRPAPGESARFSGHDHDDQHLRSRHRRRARPVDGDGDGLREIAGAIGRGGARLVPHRPTEAAW
jgi:hypothetical protein